jgi:hypothetical protein
MDKMIILNQSGAPKYELGADNIITDLRNHCQCVEEGRPEQRDGEQRVCLVCNLPITSDSTRS